MTCGQFTAMTDSALVVIRLDMSARAAPELRRHRNGQPPVRLQQLYPNHLRTYPRAVMIECRYTTPTDTAVFRP